MRRPVAIGLALTSAVVVSCVLAKVPLTDLPCPCADGWRCDSNDRCVPIDTPAQNNDAGMNTVVDAGTKMQPDAGPPVRCPPVVNSSGPGIANPVINEYMTKHAAFEGAGTDHRYEFIEILGRPSRDYSDHTLLFIDGNAGSIGIVQTIISVGQTDSAGYWVWCDSFGNDDDLLKQNSGTFLLVTGFDTAVAVGTDLDTNDDGVLETTPWTSITDSVALTDGTTPELDVVYSTVVLANGANGVNGSRLGASRIPNGTDTNTDADWMKNHFSGSGLPGQSGDAPTGNVISTPGGINIGPPPPPPPTTTTTTTAPAP